MIKDKKFSKKTLRLFFIISLIIWIHKYKAFFQILVNPSQFREVNLNANSILIATEQNECVQEVRNQLGTRVKDSRFPIGHPSDTLAEKLHKLFSPHKTYPIAEELCFKTVRSRQEGRSKVLHAFCDSNEYKRSSKNLTSLVIFEGHQVTLIKKFNTYECRAPKTGKLSK